MRAVNAGGDLAVHGQPPNASGWEIAIDGSVPSQVSLRSGALATSSVERRRWQVDGQPRHHLLDPRTGMPATTGLRSASVAAATCQQAEVAAKAALLLGPAAGSDFLLRRNLSGLLVTDDGDGAPDRGLAMTLDHTLTWEVARVGGMLAYVLVTASVALGLLLSLKATSENWPRFITNELHRFVTLVALVFTGVHTLAVLLDPFTGFSLAEVFLPLTTHYRPLWIAMGIVSAYLLVAVWASEYVRKRVGYAWWRRFHYLAFAVFLLGTLHGLGTGSDSGNPGRSPCTRRAAGW